MYRSPSSHKGQHGGVLIIGGSEDYVGTLVLAGIAALRAGCDIITIAAPEKVAWAINCYSPDLITKKLPGNYLSPAHATILKPIIERHNVILLGNGIGLRKETRMFCKALMASTRQKQKVIDADGIKLLSLYDIENAIITPHAAELKLLLHNSMLDNINKIENKDKKAKALQKHLHNNVLLLKGPTDYIISKHKSIKIRGGNPGMARAGMGDVLAGLCTGFLAQTSNLIKSAEAASFLNKQLGNMLLEKKNGYSFIASDMLDEMRKLSSRGLKLKKQNERPE